MVYVIPDNHSKFEKFGFPGKYHSMLTVSSSTTASSFSGSEYGGAAILLGAGADAVGTKIFVAGGGILPGPELTEKVIYDISPSSIQATGGNIYVFKRQQ